jgi:peptidyl-tRNA hydrolase
MYILTRADLSPGLQAAQSVHAAFLLSTQSPEAVDVWLKESSTLVLLSVPDEDALFQWRDLLGAKVPHVLVREPDLGNEATSIIFAPSPYGSCFAELPLLGRIPMEV